MEKKNTDQQNEWEGLEGRQEEEGRYRCPNCLIRFMRWTELKAHYVEKPECRVFTKRLLMNTKIHRHSDHWRRKKRWKCNKEDK